MLLAIFLWKFLERRFFSSLAFDIKPVSIKIDGIAGEIRELNRQIAAARKTLETHSGDMSVDAFVALIGGG